MFGELSHHSGRRSLRGLIGAASDASGFWTDAGLHLCLESRDETEVSEAISQGPPGA